MRIRSGFSFRNSYGFVRDVLPCIETSFAPLTDRGSCYGFNQWRKLCDKAGKKAVYGFEVRAAKYVAGEFTDTYVTLIAIDRLAELNKAFALATSGDRTFSYGNVTSPVLSYDELRNLDPAHVAVILGNNCRPDLADEQEPWYYAEGPGTEEGWAQWARSRGWKPIACSNNNYPTPEDVNAYHVVLGDRFANTNTWPQHILSEAELSLYASPEAFTNRDELADRCSATMLMPHLVKPDMEETMEEWCLRGAAELDCDLSRPAYRDRLERELRIIQQLGFDDYFFLIADLIREARKTMLVGPARGSSCGSLVCYLMGITTVDPILHDLMFERFIDPNRADLPDIDIDFSEQHRESIFTYLSHRYGDERVARLGTIAFLREKSMAKAMAATLGVPGFKLEPVLSSVVRDEGNASSDYLPQYFSKALEGTLEGARAMEEYPELAVAPRVEGHPTHHGIHAAGAVITSTAITDYVAVDLRGGGMGTAELDKFDAQDLGILKVDALGLSQLSVFEDCLELIGKPRDWTFLYSLPLDDPAAFKVLNDRKFSGIFQYNGPSVQGVSSSFHVDNFEDMVATTSLARPGPMGAGGTDRWLEIRTGKRKTELPHPLFEPILGRTHGIVIYQEQVMRIGREIGDMEWPRVTKLRKVVQYFTGKAEMDAFRLEYLTGATAKGIPADRANAFWDEMLAFGSYAFNRSHAVAYSMISYWCCWLKAHHPVEFAAAMLNHERQTERQRIMLREMRREGVDYVPFDPEHSGVKWTPRGGTLYGPIGILKGIGPKSVAEFLERKADGGPMSKRLSRLLSNPETNLDTLEPIEAAVRENHPDLTVLNIHSSPTPVASVGDQALRDRLFIGLMVKTFTKKDKSGRGQQMTFILRDDTGEIRGFINSRKFDDIGRRILEAGEPGKTLWAVKGSTPDGGGIIWVDMVRYLGPAEGLNN